MFLNICKETFLKIYLKTIVCIMTFLRHKEKVVLVVIYCTM